MTVTGDKSYYMSLGNELLSELAAALGLSVMPGVGDTYSVLELDNGFSVKFTPWREGSMPYYIVLFNPANHYLFELDLSMIAALDDRFWWHLKIPRHPPNKPVLNTWLGQPSKFNVEYREQIRQVKESLESGTNVPRAGYGFVDDNTWSELCDKFIELMTRILASEGVQLTVGELPAEASDDDPSNPHYQRSKARRNQRQFRLKLIRLYDCRCAITGERTSAALEAAHISPYNEKGINHSTNGILLRADLHRLLDASLIAIDPDTLSLRVSEKLARTPYARLHGSVLQPRVDGSHPSDELLRTRWLLVENKFPTGRGRS